MISSVRVLLNSFRPINNGRAELGRMQKHATGVSRLKASKELAGMGIGRRGEKGMLMHVCGKENASFKETLWNAQLSLGAPSTMKHSYWRHGFFSVWEWANIPGYLSGSPSALESCQWIKLRSEELC